MNILRFFLPGLLFGNWPIPTALAEDPVLDQRLMQLTVQAAKLSSLAFVDSTDYKVGVDDNGAPLYGHPDYEFIVFFGDELDQAVIAEKDGRCYLSFRGTTAGMRDWFQNFGLGSIDVYKDNDSSTGQSCNARAGYADFLLSDQFLQGRQALIECTEKCSDPDDCLILTGHSQGGAMATAAAILLYSRNPITITFGQPLAVRRNCDLINSEKFYRYVNSVFIDDGEEDNAGVYYDLAPLLPAAGQGRGHYGYYLLLADDTAAVKFLGVDDEDSGFSPGLMVSPGEAHKMEAEKASYSYESRVTALFDNNVFPVSTVGFSSGVPCDPDNPMNCASGDCGTDMVCA